MISLGLIGYPLSHSLSPRLHTAALAAACLEGEYHLYPIAPEDGEGLANLTDRMRQGEIQGLNVTIPHKQTVMACLDDLSPSARAIGAVNTIVMKDGRLIGENTDAPGFLADLHRAVPKGFKNKNAIVMGAGGAARALVHALLSEGWMITLAVRQADIPQAAQLIAALRGRTDNSVRSVLLDVDNLKPCLENTDLIVNATPLGMFPEVSGDPWPDGLSFPPNVVVYDLVYNPRETALLRQAREEGKTAVSGMGMLIEQAALSFEAWTGFRPTREVLFQAVEAG